MAKLTLAFESLNLRWNPFGAPALDDLAPLAVVDVEPFLERLRRPGFALQVLGESGRGKSTHLRALHSYFPEAPYIWFPEGEKPSPIPQAALLFLDETQRLPARLRRQVFSRPASFVIGSHMNHARELTRAGLEQVTILLQGLTNERLAEIIQRRIEWARRGPGPLPEVSEATMTQLIDQYGDDLSAILARLYEDFQALERGKR